MVDDIVEPAIYIKGSSSKWPYSGCIMGSHEDDELM